MTRKGLEVLAYVPLHFECWPAKYLKFSPLYHSFGSGYWNFCLKCKSVSQKGKHISDNVKYSYNTLYHISFHSQMAPWGRWMIAPFTHGKTEAHWSSVWRYRAAPALYWESGSLEHWLYCVISEWAKNFISETLRCLSHKVRSLLKARCHF